ncbi:MAG: hypothetical protein JKY49_00555 [Cohaesibacteraceae bacterium]|nr:hypothetical protein [Cohaesibacteraceae bacterium]MBL4876205.1 hypothetical protein [Cohaesibacteraceae bacterium]
MQVHEVDLEERSLRVACDWMDESKLPPDLFEQLDDAIAMEEASDGFSFDAVPIPDYFPKS